MASSTLQARSSRGFTLIEAMVAVGIAGTLATVALPSVEQVVLRSHRMDALLNLSLVQLAQERGRAASSTYAASLADIGMASLASGKHYNLAIVSASATGFDLLASATGTQTRDTTCRHLRLTVDGANTVRASGPTVATTNGAAENQRCWQRALS